VLGFDPGGEARPGDLPGLEVLAIGDKYPTRTRELETSQENGKRWKIYFASQKVAETPPTRRYQILVAALRNFTLR